MHNLFEMFQIIDAYYSYLKARNFRFSDQGYPLFEEWMFLDEYPDLVVPIQQRKNRRVKAPARTVLCFFCGDKLIYPRYVHLFDEIKIYQSFMGIVEPDLTVTQDMDREWQDVLMLLNQLFMAVLAVNDVKVVLNTRIGLAKTFHAFNYIPRKIMVASGFLGGCRNMDNGEFAYLSKIMRLYPGKILLYGACDKTIMEQLNRMGLSYRKYMSFRTLCKEVA